MIENIIKKTSRMATSILVSTVAFTLLLVGSVVALPAPQAPVSGVSNKYTNHNHDPLTQQGSSGQATQNRPGGAMGAYGHAVESSTPAPSAVPEPATGILVGLGLAAAALARRRRSPSPPPTV